MQHFFGLLLDVATPIAVALFVVLPLVGIGGGVLATWLILKKVSKKKSEKKLDEAEKIPAATRITTAPAAINFL